MQFDRRDFIASLGGASVVALMTSAQKADALESYSAFQQELEAAPGGAAGHKPYPTMADLRAEDAVRTAPRRGVGALFDPLDRNVKHVGLLDTMPAKPTLADFFEHRFFPTREHCLQSANRALKTGMSEEIVLACLLHDTAHALCRVDHGWWSAQLYEPYVSEKVAFAIRYHQTLRFYPDETFGYDYPERYLYVFGEDFKPDPYLEETYQMLRKHRWYEAPRLVTVNDLYSFDPKQKVSLDPFIDIIGRHFRQPKEGLGYDNSPAAHMWRTMMFPDRPL